MGVFDKFKDLVGVGEEEYYYDDEEVMEEIPSHHAQSRFQRPQSRSNIVSMEGGYMDEMKLVITEPSSFEESSRLVDELKRKKPAIINLEKLDQETARKIFDFLSGATYALNGNVQKIANNIFVFAPDNVDITSNKQPQNAEFEFSQEKNDDNMWR